LICQILVQNLPLVVLENLNAVHPQFYYPRPSVYGLNPQQTLTNASLVALRQLMEDSNHEMVNILTQQIGTVFNPLIRDTHNTYLALSDQMGRIADFFGAPPRQNVQIPQVQNPRLVEMPVNGPNDGNLINLVPQPVVEPPAPGVQERVPILVKRNHDPDQIVRQAQQVNLEGQNNIANVVEILLTQNGFNLGLHRPNFVSPLPEYVTMEELPRGWKIPKFTKFGGETNESIVEQITRYLTEAGDITNNENLRMKFFSSSLIKNAFIWYTTLPPGSIFTWSKLEKVFHAQFYMGQSKISLKELASVRRKTTESIDDYLKRFRLLKNRRFNQVPEHELVKMAASDLEYSI